MGVWVGLGTCYKQRYQEIKGNITQVPGAWHDLTLGRQGCQGAVMFNKHALYKV
jgi:hypothetical protein